MLQAEPRACVESRYKGLMMVAGQINGKEMKALVDTGATDNFVSDQVVHKLGLDVKPCDSQVKAVNSEAMPVSRVASTELRVGSWSGQCDFMTVRLDDFDVILGIDFFITPNVMILPRLGGFFISGGNKPAFVRGEYEGDTTTRKKSKTVEAGPSNASSLKEGTHSPYIADFCSIGKMQEEMDRRWAKAQQVREVGPELFTYADVLRRERECEGKHSVNVRGGKRALVQSTSGKKEGKTVASTSVCGVVCKPLEKVCGLMRQVCTWDSAWSIDRGRHKVYAGVGRQWCRAWPENVRSRQADARSTRLRCVDGCGLVRTALDRCARHLANVCGRMRAGAHSTRPMRAALGQGRQTLRTDAALCAQHSAKVDKHCGWMRPGAHNTRPRGWTVANVCSLVRTALNSCAQTGRTVGTVSAGWQTIGTEYARWTVILSRQGKDVHMGSAQVRTACAHGRPAGGCRQRPRLGGWLRGQ
ncbi:UNVERIFIED_CONTAM: hypothetical protein Slati_2689600 [Sesamum latifolium]|uniref:Uncharacterized protein n=1 Tax=Sesamum latifolium TaxID=2727402 RepID=A0AAW2VVX4_9LAMI